VVPDALKIIARRIIKLGRASGQTMMFCDAITWNPTQDKRRQREADHTTSLDDIFNHLRGYTKIYIADHPECPYRYNDKAIIAAVWLAPWAVSALSQACYWELDGSFTILKPYVYTVPQAIINNVAIPLGFAMGPSESLRLFEIFRDALLDVGMADEQLFRVPVLSDEGSALKAYARAHHEKHFFCFCHLLRKFGAGTPACNIAKRALFCSTEAEFLAQIPQLIADLAVHLEKHLISPQAYSDLSDFLGFVRDADGKITGYGSFVHGLWLRSEYGVSTCDNHAERFHRTLNAPCDTRTALPDRIRQLVTAIQAKFDSYTIDPHRQAIKHFKRLKNQSSGKDSVCRFRCGWAEILAKRYGAIDFPCPHVCVESGNTIQFHDMPQIAPTIESVCTCIEDTEHADWLQKLAHKREIPAKVIEWSIAGENDEQVPADHTTTDFIVQIAHELIGLRRIDMSWDSLLIHLGREFERCCGHTGDPDDVMAKSLFRAHMLQKILSQDDS
jgi:hypothetical protein